ncbi:MAG: glycine cleavage system protein H, partial [Chloroflexia bacterium]|nr:glycine cleavage system protein H [Chloroflexia bacterium]
MSISIPGDLRYSTSDEWVRTEGEEVVIGITDYAQDALGDVVYIELPAVGTVLTPGE